MVSHWGGPITVLSNPERVSGCFQGLQMSLWGEGGGGGGWKHRCLPIAAGKSRTMYASDRRSLELGIALSGGVSDRGHLGPGEHRAGYCHPTDCRSIAFVEFPNGERTMLRLHLASIGSID